MKALTLSILTLAFAISTFAQMPAGPGAPAAQPQPAAPAETARPAAASAPAVPAASPVTVDNLRILVPRDTLIPVVLMTTINTKSDFVGQAIFCKSIYPITVGNHIIIPEGSSVRGTVTEVIRPGRVKGRAKLGLRFDELVLPNGTTRQLRATLAGFGSAGKERFNPKEGQIEGDQSKDAAGKLEETTNAGAEIGSIAGIGEDHPGEGVAIGAASGAAFGVIWILATRGSDIVLAQGTSLTLQLSQPVAFDREEVEPPSRYDEKVKPNSRYDGGPTIPRRE